MSTSTVERILVDVKASFSTAIVDEKDCVFQLLGSS